MLSIPNARLMQLRGACEEQDALPMISLGLCADALVEYCHLAIYTLHCYAILCPSLLQTWRPAFL